MQLMESIFMPVYSPKEDILSSDSMLNESAVTETMKLFLIKCVFQIC